MFRTASGWRALSGGLLVAAMVAGCSTTAKVGRDFAYGEFASRARQGESTKAQVQEMLGAPASQGPSAPPIRPMPMMVPKMLPKWRPWKISAGIAPSTEVRP